MKNIVKVQSVLAAIANKRRVFFNITVYKNNGLVKEHGKTQDLRTNWVLTEKGERILNNTEVLNND